MAGVDVTPPSKKSGKVKWFNPSKGYGFIKPDDGSGELFVHQTSISVDGFRYLREGESVEFATDTSFDGRPQAQDVTSSRSASVEETPAPNANEESGNGELGGYGGRSRRDVHNVGREGSYDWLNVGRRGGYDWREDGDDAFEGSECIGGSFQCCCKCGLRGHATSGCPKILGGKKTGRAGVVGGRDRTRDKCYTCGKIGRIDVSHDCIRDFFRFDVPSETKEREKVCYRCGSPLHFVQDCYEDCPYYL